MDPVLFPSGIRQDDIVAIIGPPNAGKTFLMTHIISQCLLPKSFDGCDAGVVFINTDHHFSVLKLAEIMANKISASKKVANQPEIDKIVETQLTKLQVMNCYNSTQLNVTIVSLQYSLGENTNAAVILIDSLTAFYWPDRITKGVAKMDSYKNDLLRMFRKYTSVYQIPIIYTQELSYGSKKNEWDTENSDSFTTFVVTISKNEETSKFNVDVSKTIKEFSIVNSSLTWAFEKNSTL